MNGRRNRVTMTPHTELMNLRWCESRLKQMEVLGKDHWRYRHFALGISFIRDDIQKYGMRQLTTKERSDQLQAIADEKYLENKR
jgi:hypothetical protein